MTKPSEITVKTWVRLLRAHRTALSHVEQALKNEGFPQLVWYDVLLELERAGISGLRPFELEDRLLLPQYGISRLLDRIDKAGYLRRGTDQNDGRGQRLTITEAGRKLRKQMWLIYGPAIEDSIGGKITSNQACDLSRLLALLIDE